MPQDFLSNQNRPPQASQPGQRRTTPSMTIPGMAGRMNAAFRPVLPGQPVPGLPTQPRIPEAPRVPQLPQWIQRPQPSSPQRPGSTMPRMRVGGGTPGPQRETVPGAPGGTPPTRIGPQWIRGGTPILPPGGKTRLAPGEEPLRPTMPPQVPGLPGVPGAAPQAPTPANAPWSDRIQDLMNDPTFLNPDDFYYPGSGRWQQDFSPDDDVTIDGGGPDTWGAGASGDLPESWMGEIQNFAPEYQQAMEQAWQIGDEELFQALRNEARMRPQAPAQQRPTYTIDPPTMPEGTIFPDDLYYQRPEGDDDDEARRTPPVQPPARPAMQPYIAADPWWDQVNSFW